MISRISLVKIFPRFASAAPFLCLMLLHLECPDIGRTPLKGYYGSWHIGNITLTIISMAFLQNENIEAPRTGVPQSPRRGNSYSIASWFFI
jgi:hypothetical protein